VIEDNEAVREIASAMIREMGLPTLEAANGAEGLRIIQHRNDIGLVLSDVIMAGGMNGPEFAAQALKVRPDLRVLFMSGYAAGITRASGLSEDAFDLVNKPFTRGDLTEKVRRALAA
jgi:CheY-like chemotaxis protein